MSEHILAIEDNEQNYYLINYLLSANGFKVECAKNGKDGIEKAKQMKPNLILLDVQLPDIDGYTVAEELKKHNETKKIPIVAVTSFAMVGDKEKILKAGADGYLEKPIDPDTFMDSIKPFLEKNELRGY